MEKILLVDDDEELLLVLQHALKANGYAVMTLSDGSQVLPTIGTFLPDIVILDINMGRWDGHTICKQIKSIEAWRQIPVVLYSGLAADKDTVTVCKADLFLQKPLSTSYFLKKIGNLTPV